MKILVSFRDEQHKARYLEYLNRMQYADCYHESMAYLLALDTVCADHVLELFDFEADAIKPDAIGAAWQTGTSSRTSRLAFNLWNNLYTDHTSVTVTGSDGYELETASRYFTPSEIFSCNYMPFYCEAIRLRFSLYDTDDREPFTSVYLTCETG